MGDSEARVRSTPKQARERAKGAANAEKAVSRKRDAEFQPRGGGGYDCLKIGGNVDSTKRQKKEKMRDMALQGDWKGIKEALKDESNTHFFMFQAPKILCNPEVPDNIKQEAWAAYRKALKGVPQEMLGRVEKAFRETAENNGILKSEILKFRDMAAGLKAEQIMHAARTEQLPAAVQHETKQEPQAAIPEAVPFDDSLPRTQAHDSMYHLGAEDEKRRKVAGDCIFGDSAASCDFSDSRRPAKPVSEGIYSAELDVVQEPAEEQEAVRPPPKVKEFVHRMPAKGSKHASRPKTLFHHSFSKPAKSARRPAQDVHRSQPPRKRPVQPKAIAIPRRPARVPRQVPKKPPVARPPAKRRAAKAKRLPVRSTARPAAKTARRRKRVLRQARTKRRRIAVAKPAKRRTPALRQARRKLKPRARKLRKAVRRPKPKTARKTRKPVTRIAKAGSRKSRKRPRAPRKRHLKSVKRAAKRRKVRRAVARRRKARKSVLRSLLLGRRRKKKKRLK